MSAGRFVYVEESPEGPAWAPLTPGDPLVPIVSGPDDNEEPDEDPDPAVVAVLYSTRPTREQALPLAGATVAAPLAVFVNEPGIASVTFDVGRVGEYTERNAPYDYKGGTGSTANMWSPADGSYTLPIRVVFTDQNRPAVTITIPFVVDSPDLPVDPNLPAPTLAAPAAGVFSVALSWSSVSGATGYRVFRDTILVRDQAGTTWTNEGLTAGVTYNYRVAAYSAVGQGALSNAQAATPTGGTGGQQPNTFKPSSANVGHGTDGLTASLSPLSGSSFPAGTVLRDKIINGQLYFAGPGWEMINCRQTYTGSGWAITTANGGGGRIERSTIEAKNGVAVGSRDRTTVRYAKIIAGFDGIKAWHYSLYESNYIYMARPAGSDKHSDGIQGEGKTNWTARGNFVDVDHDRGGNFSIFCQGFNGTEDKDVYDVLIENNWVSCGNSATATGDGKTSTGRLHNVVVRGNRYARQGRYYPRVHQQKGDTRFDKLTNVWDDTGQPILKADGTPNP